MELQKREREFPYCVVSDCLLASGVAPVAFRDYVLCSARVPALVAVLPHFSRLIPKTTSLDSVIALSELSTTAPHESMTRNGIKTTEFQQNPNLEEREVRHSSGGRPVGALSGNMTCDR